jgi:phage/plasmid-like protein (TIGR03299 family)
MAHEVENMFSANREVPWHGLGTVLPAYPTSKREILVAAGLDWEVGEFPIEVSLPSGTRLTAEDKKAIVRLSDETLLSVMGGNYSPIQPATLVDFAFSLLEVSDLGSDSEPPILFETGMSLSGGRVNTLMCRVPKGILVGGADAVTLYIGFVTSHDGSLRFGAHVTPIREVCKNTLNLGLRNAVQSWSAKHTASALNSIEEARKTLRLTNQYADEFERQMNALLDQEFTKRQFEQMVADLFPKAASEPAPFSREQYSMIGLLESSPTIDDGIRYTKYGALNAVREFDDWGRRFNEGGRQSQRSAPWRRCSERPRPTPTGRWPTLWPSKKDLAMSKNWPQLC